VSYETSNALARLLWPVTPDQFFAEYWGKRPLFVKGDAAKLERLIPGGFTRADMLAAVRSAAAGGNPHLRVWSQRQRQGRAGTPFEIRNDLSVDEIEAVLAEGDNVGCENYDHPRLASLASALKAQLRVPGEVTIGASLSPASNGWPLHLDNATSISIQCEGRKRFWVSEQPAIDWPRGSIVFTEQQELHTFLYDHEDWEQQLPIRSSTLLEYELEPGDVVYIPCGALHNTEALSESTLNVLMSFSHGQVLPLLMRVVERLSRRDPNWRHLPLATQAGACTGELPPDVHAFFDRRLADLRRALDGITADEPEFNEEWQRMLADPGETTRPILAVATAADDEPVEPNDRLRVTQRAPITWASGRTAAGEPTLTLYFMGAEFGTTGAYTELLRTLAQQDCFVAAAALDWCADADWPTTQEYLGALLRHGLLERA
jgi:ribosomal protein L16 Arg81 hydroxylase